MDGAILLAALGRLTPEALLAFSSTISRAKESEGGQYAPDRPLFQIVGLALLEEAFP